MVKLVLCIQPIPKEQCASTAWQPGTNSSSGPVPRSRALAGEVTDYICLIYMFREPTRAPEDMQREGIKSFLLRGERANR